MRKYKHYAIEWTIGETYEVNSANGIKAVLKDVVNKLCSDTASGWSIDSTVSPDGEPVKLITNVATTPSNPDDSSIWAYYIRHTNGNRALVCLCLYGLGLPYQEEETYYASGTQQTAGFLLKKCGFSVYTSGNYRNTCNKMGGLIISMVPKTCSSDFDFSKQLNKLDFYPEYNSPIVGTTSGYFTNIGSSTIGYQNNRACTSLLLTGTSESWSSGTSTGVIIGNYASYGLIASNDGEVLGGTQTYKRSITRSTLTGKLTSATISPNQQGDWQKYMSLNILNIYHTPSSSYESVSAYGHNGSRLFLNDYEIETPSFSSIAGGNDAGYGFSTCAAVYLVTKKNTYVDHLSCYGLVESGIRNISTITGLVRGTSYADDNGNYWLWLGNSYMGWDSAYTAYIAINIDPSSDPVY